MDTANESQPSEPDPNTDETSQSNAAPSVSDENTGDSQPPPSITSLTSVAAFEEASDDHEFKDALDTVPPTDDAAEAQSPESDAATTEPPPVDDLTAPGSQATVCEDDNDDDNNSGDSGEPMAVVDAEPTETDATADRTVPDAQTENQEIDGPEEVDMDTVNDHADKEKCVFEDPFDQLKHNTSSQHTAAAIHKDDTGFVAGGGDDDNGNKDDTGSVADGGNDDNNGNGNKGDTGAVAGGGDGNDNGNKDDTGDVAGGGDGNEDDNGDGNGDDDDEEEEEGNDDDRDASPNATLNHSTVDRDNDEQLAGAESESTPAVSEGVGDDATTADRKWCRCICPNE